MHGSDERQGHHYTKKSLHSYESWKISSTSRQQAARRLFRSKIHRIQHSQFAKRGSRLDRKAGYSTQTRPCFCGDLGSLSLSPLTFFWRACSTAQKTRNTQTAGPNELGKRHQVVLLLLGKTSVPSLRNDSGGLTSKVCFCRPCVHTYSTATVPLTQPGILFQQAR
jgi:hypothetical protein